LADKLSTWIVLKLARRAAKRFAAAAGAMREAQERVLVANLRRNASSDQGRALAFDRVRTVEDYRRVVPLSDYDSMAPYVARVMAGETGAMFPHPQKIRMFAMTSGTTGRTKYIPVTPQFLKDYREGWLVWGWHAHQAHPEAWDGSNLQVVGSGCVERADSGVPCGSVSGLIADMQSWLVRRHYVVPRDVRHLHGLTKYFLTARVSVVRNVTLFVTPNPSTLLVIARMIDENRESLIECLEDGRPCDIEPSDVSISPGLRRLCARRKRNHARRLRGIIDRTGRLLAKDVWPNLGLLGTWKGGPLACYHKQLPEYFADTPARDIGLLASEGRMTIPLSDEGSAGALDVASTFFEFIPEDDLDNPRAKTLLAHQLEKGAAYSLVLTNSAGLYRYNIQDIVRVVDFYHQTPMVEFLNRGKNTSSITGEKLTEFQAASAIQSACAEVGADIVECVVAPRWARVPHYCLIVEADDGMSASLPARLATSFDAKLCELNVEYADKRRSGRLASLVTLLVKPGLFAQMRTARTRARGSTQEQYKHQYLVGDLDFTQGLDVLQEVAAE